ncbi:hypothetical protein [Leucobacter denitrificans]|uniref:Uncharacterized protein n=1 Tax=Leucobacter denitrificans TaxID=683042 RepID=A0A7G9S322_9MICO|nr:hypothetical protein [Leucobacter denitrificans]QNN62247.1 hypothetical protein H9L06_08130 [Leucobacter denitrificans]
MLAADSESSVWNTASQINWSYGWEALSGVSLLSALSQIEMHIARVRAQS